MKEMPNVQTISPGGPADPMSEEAVFAAFDGPVGTPHASLYDFVMAGKTLMILNDLHRATPTARILGLLDRYMKRKGSRAGLAGADVHFIIATGSHRPPDEAGLGAIMGPFYDAFVGRVMVHNSRSGAHTHILTTGAQTPVFIDDQVLDFDRFLPVNSVEPHYFAGYTGGRKSFLPGVCSWETIETNHALAMHEDARPLVLEGNPVHDDMVDAVSGIIDRLGADVFAINTVASGGEITSLAAGDLFNGMEALVEPANDVFCARVEGPFDVVVAEVGPPQSGNLYQSLKGFEHGKLAVREGGILVLVAECGDGIGPDNFYRVATSRTSPADIIEDIKKRYTLGAHKVTNLLDFLGRSEMYVVSGLDPGVVRDIFCQPFSSLEGALKAAAIELGDENPRMLWMKEANNVVPILE